MEPSPQLVYLVLGSTGSGRRAIVADLIEAGLSEGERAAVLLAADEPPDPADASLGNAVRWSWSPEGTIDAEPPAGATRVFFVTYGRGNPVDQIEGFKTWTEARGMELARVLCVVNCKLAEKHPPLGVWYDACIHFSDVVLLNRREGVPNKWMGDFQAAYRAQRFPCLFELVKADSVANPALILEPRALRISQVFDEEPEWDGDLDGEGDDGEEQEDGDEAEDEDSPVEDPYFARVAGGRRIKVLPDISKYLSLPNWD